MADQHPKNHTQPNPNAEISFKKLIDSFLKNDNFREILLDYSLYFFLLRFSLFRSCSKQPLTHAKVIGCNFY